MAAAARRTSVAQFARTVGSPIVSDQRVVIGELIGNPVQDLRNRPRIGAPSTLL